MACGVNHDKFILVISLFICYYVRLGIPFNMTINSQWNMRSCIYLRAHKPIKWNAQLFCGSISCYNKNLYFLMIFFSILILVDVAMRCLGLKLSTKKFTVSQWIRWMCVTHILCNRMVNQFTDHNKYSFFTIANEHQHWCGWSALMWITSLWNLFTNTLVNKFGIVQIEDTETNGTRMRHSQ